MVYCTCNELSSDADVCVADDGFTKFSFHPGKEAVLEYDVLGPKLWDMYHTEVPEELRGRGMAGQLAQVCFLPIIVTVSPLYSVTSVASPLYNVTSVQCHLCSITSVQCHLCTVSPLYSITSVQHHLCTVSPLYSVTSVASPLYSVTSVQRHLCTVSPL